MLAPGRSASTLQEVSFAAWIGELEGSDHMLPSKGHKPCSQLEVLVPKDHAQSLQQLAAAGAQQTLSLCCTSQAELLRGKAANTVTPDESSQVTALASQTLLTAQETLCMT